jgi:hypothetical protein
VTSFTFSGDAIVGVDYAEPAGPREGERGA